MKRPFVFYPAQFWAHKNHVYILEALAYLRKDDIFIDAVFTGNDFGNKDFLIKCADKLGLKEQIHWLGFVSRSELEAIYQTAVALVMPTYFGPTNIPPLEAFQWECPVCCPDLPGLRDQVEEAGFLMNLDDPESLVYILKKILAEEPIVREKKDKGYDVLKRLSPDNYLNIIRNIFDEYEKTLKCHSMSAFEAHIKKSDVISFTKE